MLVIIQIINQGAVAKRIGLYSTSTSVVHLDQIKDDLITIPVEQLPLRSPVYETSDQITEVNTYLLKIAPRSKFDFNYQPLANQIRSQWVSVEYPADYYVKGGSNTSYLRDEVYAFFIRWVYSTGDKSSSYHIPGRAPMQYTGVTPSVFETAPATGIDVLDTNDRVFEVYNTATLSAASGTLPDGGVIKATGRMGYWESTEKYPDNRHDIWDSSSQCWSGTTDPQYDLCAEPIRHHKFPDNITASSLLTNHYSQGGTSIRLMGVNFTNIFLPKDNDGNDIPGIVGYEILRGSREGNRSIIAKGMVNNMRTYDIKGNSAGNRIGLYPNYPFNTIKPLSSLLGGNVSGYNDPYIKLTKDSIFNQVINQDVPTNLMTFHSPDTNFRNPYLSVTELKVYGSLRGTSIQYFQEPNNHPKFKLLADIAVAAGILAGVIELALQQGGKWTINESLDAPATGGSDALGAVAATARASAGTFALARGANDVALSTYLKSGGYLLDALNPLGDPIYQIFNIPYTATAVAAATAGGVGTKGKSYTKDVPKYQYAGVFGIANFVQQSFFYFSEGANTTIRLIYALLHIDNMHYNLLQKVIIVVLPHQLQVIDKDIILKIVYI